MYKITADEKGGYTVYLPNAESLTQLMENLKLTVPAEGRRMITYTEAQQIATAAGRDVPSSSLRSACARGTIPGATKRGGRWAMPEDRFREWAGIPAPRQPSDEEILFGNPPH